MSQTIQQSSLDIETAAQPLELIGHLKPKFAAPGNFKDPLKIAENIAAQERKWVEDAALSPLTGRILVIGVKPFGKEPIILEGDEITILQQFWQMVGYASEFEQWYGHNIHGFDLPFIIKRSWLHSIPVPLYSVMSGRYINDRRFIDTMVGFQCGDRQSQYVSLDTVAKFFGFPGKTEDLGSQFAEVYATDRPRAIAYHVRDLELVEGIAGRMFAPFAAAA